MNTYLLLSYMTMSFIIVIVNQSTPRNKIWRDCLIWFAAPITAPLFILFMLTNKTNK